MYDGLLTDTHKVVLPPVTIETKFTATVAGSDYIFSGKSELSGDTMEISGTNADGKISLKIINCKVGSFVLNKASIAKASFTNIKTGEIFISDKDADTGGKITISTFDVKNKYLSGTCQLVLKSSTKDIGITISNGIFQMNFSSLSRMVASVNDIGMNWKADTIKTTEEGGILTLLGISNSDKSSITIAIPIKSFTTLGTPISFTENGPCKAFYSYDGQNFAGESGSLIITAYDEANKTLQGTFKFTNSADADEIKNGSFTINF